MLRQWPRCSFAWKQLSKQGFHTLILDDNGNCFHSDAQRMAQKLHFCSVPMFLSRSKRRPPRKGTTKYVLFFGAQNRFECSVAF